MKNKFVHLSVTQFAGVTIMNVQKLTIKNSPTHVNNVVQPEGQAPDSAMTSYMVTLLTGDSRRQEQFPNACSKYKQHGNMFV